MAQAVERQQYFEVTVHHDNIKAFSAALHLLQKIGKEMTIEMESNMLTLRALNDTKSAFVGVEFHDQYFDSFQLSAQLRSFSCKVNVKPICVIFRSLKGMRQLKMRAGMVDESEHELVFEIVLMNDITRIYRFRYVDCEVLSAVFDEDQCSYVRAKPRLFSQLLTHIYQSPEVCIEAGGDFFSVRSYHKAAESAVSEGGNTRFMRTGLSVNIQEFEQYEYASNLQSEELIFCVKEVNAFLGYSEVLDLPDFDLFFSGSGRAIKYAARHDDFVASLILATIESPQHRLQSQTQPPQSPSQAQGHTPGGLRDSRRGTSGASGGPRGTAGPSEEDAEYMSQMAPSQMSLLGSPSMFTARRQAVPAHPQEGVVPLTDLAPELRELQEASSSSAAARSQLDGSQPVSTFRRPAARSGHTSSAFLRYAEDGDEEDEEDEEEEREERMAVRVQPRNENNSSSSGAMQPPAGRRKRFLDEASDGD